MNDKSDSQTAEVVGAEAIDGSVVHVKGTGFYFDPRVIGVLIGENGLSGVKTYAEDNGELDLYFVVDDLNSYVPITGYIYHSEGIEGIGNAGFTNLKLSQVDKKEVTVDSMSVYRIEFSDIYWVIVEGSGALASVTQAGLGAFMSMAFEDCKAYDAGSGSYAAAWRLVAPTYNEGDDVSVMIMFDMQRPHTGTFDWPAESEIGTQPSGWEPDFC